MLPDFRPNALKKKLKALFKLKNIAANEIDMDPDINYEPENEEGDSGDDEDENEDED